MDFRRCTFVLLGALCVVAAVGCMPKKVLAPPSPAPAPVVVVPAQSLSEKADAAWARGDMMESERLYSLVLQDSAAPQAARAIAWERVVTAAVANTHTHSALEMLEVWRTQVPGADVGPAWLPLWQRAMDQLQLVDAARRAAPIWPDALRPGPVRFAAARRALASGDPALTAVFNALYAQANPSSRASMEQELMASLAPLPDPTLLALYGAQPGPDARYPWSVLLLEFARRLNTQVSAMVPAAIPGMAVDPTMLPPEAQALGEQLDSLRARLAAVSFADAALLNLLAPVGAGSQSRQPGQPATAPALPVPSVQELITDAVPFHPACVALALPLSGPYAALGSNVQAGAALAQSQLQRAGVAVDVQFVDTQDPGWPSRLSQLPPQCVTVGGPMRPDAYTQAKTGGALAGRALFTFLGRLDDGDEGVVAWRFFPGRDDQILSMLRFAQNMGISRYGVFYPDDAYGFAMVNSLSALAPQMGGSVQNAVSYPPDAPQDWTKLAGQFVGVRLVNTVPVPSNSFEAIFLPDSWKNMDMVISTLFYQGEDSKLLMGTSLWEQVLLETPPAVLNNMQLSVFPGMWNPRSTAVPARLLQSGLGRAVDTWAALGYDFVRFASALNLTSDVSATDVNSRLEQAQRMTWSMAPLRWNAGRATQDLFIMAPATDAPVLVDAAQFKQRLDTARTRSERRASRAATTPPKPGRR